MIRDQETLNMLLDSVSRFVREQLVPIEEEVADTDHIPEHVVNQMRELGLFGMTIPEEYGGLNLSMEEEVLFSFEIDKTSPAFRSLIGTNNGIGSQGILIDGTEQQKQKYLQRMESVEMNGFLAMTDPGT